VAAKVAAMEASTDGLILGDYAESIEGRQAKTVTVERNNGFEIRYAGGSVFFRSPEVNLEETRDFNFALLALILVSMSSGQAFHLTRTSYPIGAEPGARYARVLQVMKPKAFFSPVVICPNVIEDRPSARTESIICLSGGVDSTFASMIRQDDFKYATFVRGADYPLSATEILDGLADRVRRTSEELGLTPIIVDSNLKDYVSDYGLQHTGILAACLYFTRSKFESAGWRPTTHIGASSLSILGEITRACLSA
jgi:hypothetical protein